MKDHTLDELMIVNPGRPDRLHRVRLARPAAEEPRLFLGDDGVVYHAYSTYARGVDALWGAYQWLDRAPRGRNETGPWFRRRDEYGAN